MSHDPDDPGEDDSYTAEGVRRGAGMLRSRQRRTFVVAGLVAAVVVILLLALLS